MIPNEILEKIILQQIILLKNKNGWRDIHYNIIHMDIVLRLTRNQYPYEMNFNHIFRSTIPHKSNQILKRNKCIWNCIQRKKIFNDLNYDW